MKSRSLTPTTLGACAIDQTCCSKLLTCWIPSQAHVLVDCDEVLSLCPVLVEVGHWFGFSSALKVRHICSEGMATFWFARLPACSWHCRAENGVQSTAWSAEHCL